MPNFDKTGPCGKGAGTGRGMGPCKAKSLEEQEKLLEDRLEAIRKLKDNSSN